MNKIITSLAFVLLILTLFRETETQDTNLQVNPQIQNVNHDTSQKMNGNDNIAPSSQPKDLPLQTSPKISQVSKNTLKDETVQSTSSSTSNIQIPVDSLTLEKPQEDPNNRKSVETQSNLQMKRAESSTQKSQNQETQKDSQIKGDSVKRQQSSDNQQLGNSQVLKIQKQTKTPENHENNIITQGNIDNINKKNQQKNVQHLSKSQDLPIEFNKQNKNMNNEILQKVNTGVILGKQLLKQALNQLQKSNNHQLMEKIVSSIEKQVQKQQMDNEERKLVEQNKKYASFLSQVTQTNVPALQEHKLDEIIKLKVDELKQIQQKIDGQKKHAELAKIQQANNFVNNIKDIIFTSSYQYAIITLILLMILSFVLCSKRNQNQSNQNEKNYFNPDMLLPDQDECQ